MMTKSTENSFLIIPGFSELIFSNKMSHNLIKCYVLVKDK